MPCTRMFPLQLLPSLRIRGPKRQPRRPRCPPLPRSTRLKSFGEKRKTSPSSSSRVVDDQSQAQALPQRGGDELKITQRLPQRIAMIILLCAIAAATTQDQAPAPQPTSPVQAAPAQSEAQGLAASSQNPPSETTGAAPLRVMVGKSLLINTTERLKRVSVTDPAIADPQVVSPTQILIHGRAPGEVSLLIWDELERSRSFDLRVDVDVSAAAEEEKRVFPDEQITVTPSRAAIVLSGHVSTEDVAKRAGELASAYSPKVVNVLTFGPVGAQEVLLQVKFAEVDRSALTQLGVNFFSTGAANTIGTITTGQFGGVGPQSIAPGGQTSSGTSGTGGTSTSTSINNVLNLFVFRPDINLGAVVEALQTKNLLQILAEPNLIAVNGKEASFLAG